MAYTRPTFAWLDGHEVQILRPAWWMAITISTSPFLCPGCIRLGLVQRSMPGAWAGSDDEELEEEKY